MGEISLWMRGQDGSQYIAVDIPVSDLSWTLQENTWTGLRASGPQAGRDTRLFALDNRLELYRTPTGANQYLEGETQWLLKWWRVYRTEKGEEMWSIEAWSLDCLLETRIIDYPASTTAVPNAKTQKTAKTDNMCKAIVRENM